MRALSGICLLMTLVSTGFAEVDDGHPFGPITSADVDRLFEYAKQNGVDLQSDLDVAYRGKSPEREDALGRVFRFSMRLQLFDINARTYGQIIYSSVLNLGESWGIDRYAQVVRRQTPEVQQRVRDFMLYRASLRPAAEREQDIRSCKEAYPDLFPAEYDWGKDPLFHPETSPARRFDSQPTCRQSRRCRRHSLRCRRR